MRAVCYARVSSAAQRERDTIASQLRVLPEFVQRQGWDLVRPADAYVDDGRSARAGKLDARTGLAALLRDAALGLFDVVVVVDVDRLTRSEDLAERGAILGAFQRAGVRLASASTGQVLDLSTSIGDLFGTLQAFFAAEENRKRAERVSRGKLEAAARGRKIGGRGPFGLLYDKEARAWSIDPVRGPIVQDIFARAAAGESCQALATDLAIRGLPSPGARWTKGRVHDILHATYPIGDYVTHRKTRAMATVPALVEVELWQRAHDALTANRRRGLRRTRHVYLLEALGVCGACGARMRIRSAVAGRGRAVRPAVYVCSRRLAWAPLAERRGEPRCEAPAVQTADADARAWAALCRELEDPGLPAELAAERRDLAADAHDWEADAAGYRGHLARLDQVEKALLRRFRRGEISDAGLDSELADLRRERSFLRSQLATAEKARGATISAQARRDEAVAMMARLRAQLAAATPEERREIAATLVDPGGVVFHDTAIHLEIFVDRPPTVQAEAGPRSLVSARPSAGGHESHLRIRLVA